MKLMRLARWTAIGMLLSLPFFSAPAGDAARVQSLFAPYVADGRFRGAVLVISGDKTLVDQGYGFANQEWRIPNTPETRFRVGSVTKQFTAAAIFLLQERGKLRVDDPLEKYLPSAPTAWRNVTLYQLLTHSAGIPNFTDLPEYWTRRVSPATPDQLIDMVRDKPLEFPPGTKWNYSNTGYDLLGLIVEKLSGQSYAAFLADNFFKPLGMANTGYDNALSILPRRASGYEREADGLHNADYVDASVLYAAGALYSTTHDLAIWERALFNGKVLSPASFGKMTAPYISSALEGAQYGCGLFIQKIGGHTAIGHPGFIDGFNAETLVIPGRRLTIVVLANISGPEPVMWATNLARTLLDEKQPQ